MGKKDIKAAEYLSDCARFADLCNFALYGGKRVIRAEALQEKNTKEVLSVFGADKMDFPIQKWRDILKGSKLSIQMNCM